MPLTSGIIAALAAPVLEAVGFLEWDIHWKRGGGSAFALNLYKCTLASVCFFGAATYTNNVGYMLYSRERASKNFSPWGESVQSEINLRRQRIYDDTGLNSVENQSVNQSGQERMNNDSSMSEEWKGRAANRENLKVTNLPLYNEQNVNIQNKNLFVSNTNQIQQPQGIINGNSQAMPQNSQLHNQAFTQTLHGQGIDATNVQQQNFHRQLLSKENIQPQSQKNHDSSFQQHLSRSQSRILQFFQAEESIYLVPPDKVYPHLDNPKYTEPYRPLFFEREHQIPPILLSSFLGIVLGDCAELEALRLIGARRVLIVDTFKPFAAAILGNLMLNEPLYAAAYFGMFLTVVGTYFVLMASLTQLKRQKKKKRVANIKKKEYSPKYVSDQEEFEISRLNDDPLEHDITVNILLTSPLSRHDLNSEYDSMVNNSDRQADEFMMLFEEERAIASDSICCWDSQGKLRRRNRRSLVNLRPDMGSRSRLSSNGSFGSAGSLGAGSWGNLDDVLNIDNDHDVDYFETDYFVGHDSFTNKKTTNLSKAQETYQKIEDTSFQSHQANTNKTSLNLPTKPSGVLKKSRYSMPAKSQSVQHISDTSAITKESKKMYDETQMKLSATSKTNLITSISPTIDEMISREELNFNTTIAGEANKYTKRRKGIEKSDSFDTTSTASTVMMKNIDSNSPHKRIIADKLPPPTEIMRSSSTGSFGSSKGSSIASECGPPVGWYRNSKESSTGRKIRLRTGYALAFVNVAFDAYGFVLTKKNGIGMTTWEINLLRMGFAATMMIVLTSFMRIREWRRKKRQGKLEIDTDQYQTLYPDEVEWYKLPKMPVIPWIIVSIGVLFVTFLCPALTNYALMDIPLALAITLTSVTPLYMIPLSWFLKGEKLSGSGFFGAFMAVSGVITLCLWGLDADNL